MTRVSVVVNNHNYADYLATAIDSALAQDWPDVETVVVDDGSTDGSRQVLDRYEDRARVVCKPSGGQASAFAAGLAASSGDLVIFLDADDLLLPGAARSAVEAFDGRPEVVKVSWPLWEIDGTGRRTGGRNPSRPLPRGDLRSVLLQQGADSYLSPPTSGNAWSRAFLEKVLPAPEEDFRRGADGYLITIAPLFGLVEALDQPQGCYRVHGLNGYWKGSLEERVRGALSRHDVRARALENACRRLGVTAGSVAGNPYIEWLYRLDAAISQVQAVVPTGEPFLLLDNGEWGDRLLAGQTNLPFPERDGVYWGPPADDQSAVQELRRMRGRGLRYAVVGWPAFWWLDAYPGLREDLVSLSGTDEVAIYRLDAGT